MQYVPVHSSTGQPLMPCHPARARELVRKGRAVRRFNRGLFYIKLLDRADGSTQAIVVGIDPGSKKEGFTVKSKAHTYLNIQADAVTWVSAHVETRRTMRRARRYRKTPYRECRSNRNVHAERLPPSTRARWGWKLRIVDWLAWLFPITDYIVEDIKAKTRPGQDKWNKSFSPLEVGKAWFYAELEKRGTVNHECSGIETHELRQALGLKKSKAKMSDKFEAHCVDSWTLANFYLGGHTQPDNTAMLYLVPLQFYRRQASPPATGKGQYPQALRRDVEPGSQTRELGQASQMGSLLRRGHNRRHGQSAQPADRKAADAERQARRLSLFNLRQLANAERRSLSFLPSLKAGVSAE